MNNTYENLKSAGFDLLVATGEVITVTAQVTADAASFTASAVKDVMPCVKATASIPFDTRSGYLQQRGFTKEEADLAAYRLVNQPLSVTIRETSNSLGDLMGRMSQPVSDDSAEGGVQA